MRSGTPGVSLQVTSVNTYPARPFRYHRLGWNQQFQHCYTQDEIELLNKIKLAYDVLTEKSETDFFSLELNKKLYEWWSCQYPPASLSSRFATDTFTLPHREVKDNNVFPLWNYADNAARWIANWQSERSKNQATTLVNDPVMLVLEELKTWFFDVLANQECRAEVMPQIAERQSYLKQLIYLIPNFGPDRLYFHHAQRQLTEGSQLIVNCLVSKDLTHLLSEVVSTGKSLENIMTTYLHFLLIDAEVADNFSYDYLNGLAQGCPPSPLCHIYQNLSKEVAPKSMIPLNPFYQSKQVTDKNGNQYWLIKLKNHLKKNVPFAKFVDEKGKQQYLEAVASLESLIGIRKTFEDFQMLLPKVGTYIFAFNYLEHVNLLTENYLQVIGKSQQLLNAIIGIADKGLQHVFVADNSLSHFERNMRALETRVAQGTTITAQLDKFSKIAVDAVSKYQREMNRLVSTIKIGEASHELATSMRMLVSQMTNLNHMLSGMLEGKLKPLKPYLVDRETAMHEEKDLPQRFTHESFRSPTLPVYGPYPLLSQTETRDYDDGLPAKSQIMLTALLGFFAVKMLRRYSFFRPKDHALRVDEEEYLHELSRSSFKHMDHLIRSQKKSKAFGVKEFREKILKMESDFVEVRDLVDKTLATKRISNQSACQINELLKGIEDASHEVSAKNRSLRGNASRRPRK